MNYPVNANPSLRCVRFSRDDVFLSENGLKFGVKVQKCE